jgi:hypothetical protein
MTINRLLNLDRSKGQRNVRNVHIHAHYSTNDSLRTSSTLVSFLHHQYLTNAEYLVKSSPVTSGFNTHNLEQFVSMYTVHLDRITWVSAI